VFYGLTGVGEGVGDGVGDGVGACTCAIHDCWYFQASKCWSPECVIEPEVVALSQHTVHT
jgi:hypothetical protein